ncbi:MAG: metal ABC transporter ATP-binding protein [Phycisphaeraceae bacterium]
MNEEHEGIVRDELHSAHGCAHGPLTEHRPTGDAICLDHVSYRYPRAEGNGNGGVLALDDVTLHVEQGCNLGIIGPNGAGKSTLVRIMLGLLEGYTGSVRIAGMSPREACRRGDVIGYVPQRPTVEWRFPVTAQQVVRMGLVGKTGWLRWYRKEDRSYADELMERVGVADLRDRPIGALSGGQQQRLFIARALVARPRILILDEPMVGVDEAGQAQFAQLIHELHESLGLTMVVVSHDIQAIAAGCNRVACLKRRIHYHDSPAGLTPAVLAEVFEHEIRPVVRG